VAGEHADEHHTKPSLVTREHAHEPSPAAHTHACAFAPGRVNLIGEHTDYNQGLALPFAIFEGVTVRATASGDERVSARALDGGEEDEFALADPPSARGWRAFVRGIVAELQRAGFPLVGARLEIDGGELAQGAGLSSSAALEVSLCLALLALAGSADDADRIDLARLCSRVENEWVGAQTGLLDQLASLFGAADTALCIDFQTLTIEPVPLRLEGGWRLVTLDSGERHTHASSAYNERRADCARACRLLGVESLRAASSTAVERLPEPLRRRARHVLGENARVEETVDALRANDLPAVGRLLNASHASLRDQYEVSTESLETAVAELLGAGAAGARLVGGGFGGHVLGLLAPGVEAPLGAREVAAGPGAHLLDR
jgi:galactokinase